MQRDGPPMKLSSRIERAQMNMVQIQMSSYNRYDTSLTWAVIRAVIPDSVTSDVGGLDKCQEAVSLTYGFQRGAKCFEADLTTG